jgi:membrane-bound lytic murein transglycosylase D
VELNAAKRIRTSTCVALLPLALLVGCTHPPLKADQASKVMPSVVPAVTAQAPQTSAPATVAAGSSPASSNPLAPSPTPGADSPSTAPAAADAGPADAVAGPPADSLVTSRPADLFDRMRHGFMLEDVDDPAVDSQLNWFANHPDFLERTFGRSELWLYYIVNQLEQRNMPRELALLPVIESAFEPYAYSRARASGLWQFISDTGRRFNLKQDWWYDGRRDPIEATRAALDYLQALHDEFNGDWLLAIAAYNCGELMVSRSIARNERLGLPTDFWHLKLPTETRGYVPELLAMRRLVANPARYGLEFSHIPDEPYFVQVSTGGQIDLQVVATIAGVSADELYELNPGFHRWATDPTGPFRLLVPIDAAEGLETTLAQLTPDERMRVEHYTVHRGDTVAKIALHFKTKPDVIRELNDLSATDRPVIATELRVPSRDVQLPYKVARAAMLADSPVRLYRRHGRRPQIHVVRRGDTLYSLAQRLGTDVNTLAAMNGLDPHDSLRAGQRLRVAASVQAPRSHATKASAHTTSLDASDSRRLTYVVRRGDTLYRIARLLQVTVDDLVAWNSSLSSRALHPGQVLVAFVKSRS